MFRAHYITRISSRVLLLSVLLLLLSGVLAPAQAQSNRFDTYITSRLSQLLSSGPQWQVKIGKLEGQFPFRLKADQVTVSDPQGVWAVGENVVFRWSPWTLARLLIHIEEVGAETVRVERLPTGGEKQEKAGKPFTLPKILHRMTIDKLAVGQLAFEKEALGQEALFHLEGSLQEPESRSGRVIAVHAKRIDEGPQMHLDLESTITGETPGSLTIQGSFFEAPGGWVADLLKLGNAGALNLQIQGEGPMDSWKGILNASAGQFGAVHTDIGLKVDKDMHLALTGSYDPAKGLISPDLTPVLGSETHFDLAAQLNPSEFVSIQSADIRGAGYSLQLSGRLEFNSDTIGGQWSLSLDDLGVMAPVLQTSLAGSMTASGQFAGTLDNPLGNVTIAAYKIRTQGVRIEQIRTDLQFEPLDAKDSSSSGFYITGQGQAGSIATLTGPPLPEDSLQWTFGISVPSDAAEREITVDALHIEGKYHTLDINGNFNLRDLVGNFVTSIRVDNLKPLTTYLGHEVPGSATLQAQMTADARSSSISAHMLGEYLQTEPLPPDFAALVGDSLDFAGTVDLREGNQLLVPEFHAENSVFRLSTRADMNLSEKNVDASWHLDFPKVAPLEPALGMPVSGSVKAEGTIQGPFNALRIGVSLEGDTLVVNGTRVKQVVSQLHVHGVPKEPKGDLQLTMLQAGETLALSTNFNLKGDTLSLSPISIAAPPGNKLTGDVDIDIKTRLVKGAINGDFERLSVIGPFLGEPMEGSAKLVGKFSRGNGDQKVSIKLKGQEIEGNFGRVGNLVLSANIDKLWKSPRGEADMKVVELQRPGLVVDTAALEIAGNAEQAQFKGLAKGKTVGKFNVQTAGSLSRSNSTVRIRLSTLRGKLGSYPLQLYQPAMIQYSPQEVSIGDISVTLGKSRIEASGNISPKQVRLNAGFQGAPLSLFSIFGAPELRGTADGALQVRGVPSSPSASMELKLADVRYPSPGVKNVPAAALTAKADLGGGRLSAAVAIYGLVERPITGNFSIPIAFSLSPFDFSLLPQGDISGHLDAQGNLNALAAWIPQPDSVFSGPFNASLNLGGTLSAPNLAGNVSVRNGSYQNLKYGTVLQDLNVAVVAEKERARIEEFSATDGSGGTVKGTGWVAFEGLKHFPLQLNVTINNATLVRMDDATVKTSGKMELSGSAAHMALTGNLGVESAQLSIPKRLPATITKLEVIEINAPKGRGIPATVKKETVNNQALPMELRLQIAVNAPGRIFVRGRGLDSEWRADLRITGTADNPAIVGTLSTVRGKLDLLDSQFKLTEGNVRFYGATPTSPSVDMTAEAKAKDITVQIIITGQASDPKLELKSEPQLPNDEILARLLFNRKVNELGPLQVLQLARAAASLSGRTDALDVLGRTRKFLGLQQLDIRQVGQPGNQETGVGLGKYLTDKVYVDVEKGFANETSKVTVDVEVTPNISVESSAGLGDVGPGIGIKWNYDY